MTPLTPVRALWLRATARRLSASVAHLLHRWIIADPLGRDPQAAAACKQLARDYANATALDGALTAYLERAQ